MKMFDTQKGLNIEDGLKIEDIVWLSIRQEPFEIYGLFESHKGGSFCRMPGEVADGISSGVSGLYRNTAGGRVRFSTDSPYIAIKAAMPSITRFPHMPLSGTLGLDLYVRRGEKDVYLKTFMPPCDIEDGYECAADVDGALSAYTINFPLYNDVDELYIGLKRGCRLTFGEKYADVKPVVYYGSSITQGGCASRSGNAYESIISRRLDVDYINLGFSGNAKGEPEMAKYISALDMSVFVCDYDYNAPGVQHLKSTHFEFYEIFRSSQPDTPYVMISNPDFDFDPVQNGLRREVIAESFSRARALGDKNVFFIDGEALFGTDFRDSCTVDALHPNDLGFYRMASVIGDVLEGIIGRADV
ncbi:MAG: hypothetical protein GX051_04095 [Clostridiales bacterium]|nr:hypothetical protein [Clostridiales bacterium]